MSFGNIVAVSFIDGENQNTLRKPSTCRKSLTNFITYCCIVYTSHEWDSNSQRQWCQELMVCIVVNPTSMRSRPRRPLLSIWTLITTKHELFSRNYFFISVIDFTINITIYIPVNLLLELQSYFIALCCRVLICLIITPIESTFFILTVLKGNMIEVMTVLFKEIIINL